MVGVNVSPLPKKALLSGMFEVPLLPTFRYKCHISKEVFPDHTSPLALHGSLMGLYTPWNNSVYILTF